MIDITERNGKMLVYINDFLKILFAARNIKINNFVYNERTPNHHMLCNNASVNISVYGLMKYDVTDFGRWRIEIISKLSFICARLHGLTSNRFKVVIFNAVRKSNLR
jgi:hypothetical protein